MNKQLIRTQSLELQILEHANEANWSEIDEAERKTTYQGIEGEGWIAEGDGDPWGEFVLVADVNERRGIVKIEAITSDAESLGVVVITQNLWFALRGE